MGKLSSLPDLDANEQATFDSETRNSTPTMQAMQHRAARIAKQQRLAQIAVEPEPQPEPEPEPEPESAE